ncbi:hypothetical protein BGZ63DRAFT_346051 [Mariannaea sp. PMI_226]|nr:hypothetical protein BGZ63DRAFT_346051 [Mariannaea sp. PMI_226]
MLTVKQPTTYGFKSVHDLPTPPSTSRPSPPLINQEPIPKSLPSSYRRHSPPVQPMSAPHRGLPPPAAMTLPPQQPSTTGVPPPTHHAPPPQPPPPPPSLTPSHQQRDPWGQLPPPPQQWQGAEESMRHWLQARVEEDRRRQEEERTRQESLRLEQRKVEMDMLRTSLSGGIPPAMVPIVFAGMGGGGALSQTAIEWMQQFIPPSQAPRAQIMPPQGPVSPEHQREAPPSASMQYHSLPPSAAPPSTTYVYPGSPTRPRGQTLGGAVTASTPTCLIPPSTARLLQWHHTSICSSPNNLYHKNPKQAPQYTFITGSRQRHKPVVVRTGRQALPGKVLENAKPQGNIISLYHPHLEESHDIDLHRPTPQVFNRIHPNADVTAGTLDKGVISHRIDLLVQAALVERASEGHPYVACHQCQAQRQD